jgi:hypothetical protein
LGLPLHTDVHHNQHLPQPDTYQSDYNYDHEQQRNDPYVQQNLHSSFQHSNRSTLPVREFPSNSELHWNGYSRNT